MNIIRKRENTDQIIPSTFKAYLKSIKIRPFWNQSVAMLSVRLFLPINDNIQPNLNGQPKEFSNYVYGNEFYLNKDKNDFKLELNNDPVEDVIIKKTKIVRLFPTRKQRIILKKMIGSYRYFYNRTIEYFKNYNKTTRKSHFHVNPKDENSKVIINLPKTKIYKTKNGESKTVNLSPYNLKSIRPYLKTDLPKWLIDKYPSHLIDQAINEACIAITTNFKKSNKTGIPFKIKYKKKEKINIMKIDGTFMSKNKNALFANLKVNKERIFKEINANDDFYKYGKKMTNLSWNSVTNKWNLYIPIEEKQKEISSKYQIASVDPGIRKFGVIYSENHIVKLGTNADNKIFKVCKEIDIINSRMSRKSYYEGNKFYKVNSKRKKNLRKALHRKINYLKNKRNELHWKTINYMCKNYKKIIYPHFETQKMAGKLNSKLARSMYSLGFYQFKQRLIDKCREYKTQLYIRSEAYTSKTCTNCGFINNNLERNEVYDCPQCKIIIDRDVNGARNILLKNMDCI